MQAHRDLQYQLYTLALHRYLRHRMGELRLPRKRHFGGVIHSLLRGVDSERPGSRALPSLSCGGVN